MGPTLSFRGIDNVSYYWLQPGDPRYYDNFTGCGNALNLTHPRVLQMVMDSLRYWGEVCHVDGFRFDLATTLARTGNGFDGGSAFLKAVRQDPVLAKVKLVAEPWDIGLGGYQLGQFPPGWSEWNDAFRRTVRRFWTASDGEMLGELASRMTASADIFRRSGRGPQASINHTMRRTARTTTMAQTRTTVRIAVTKALPTIPPYCRSVWRCERLFSHR
jgi:glycogen operon protein